MEAMCEWCGQQVPVNPDGTCFLGHPAVVMGGPIPAPEAAPPDFVDVMAPPPAQDDMIAPLPDVFVLGEDGGHETLAPPPAAGPAMAVPAVPAPAFAAAAPPMPMAAAPPPMPPPMELQGAVLAAPTVAQPLPMAPPPPFATSPAVAPPTAAPAPPMPVSMPAVAAPAATGPHLTPPAPGPLTESLPAVTMAPPGPMMAPVAGMSPAQPISTLPPQPPAPPLNPVDMAFAPLTGLQVAPPPIRTPVASAQPPAPEAWNLVPVSPGVAVYEYRPPGPPQPNDEVVAQLPPPHVPTVGVGPMPAPQQQGLFPAWEDATVLQEPAQAIAYPAPMIVPQDLTGGDPQGLEAGLPVGDSDLDVPQPRRRQMLMLVVLGVVAIGAGVYAAVTFLF